MRSCGCVHQSLRPSPLLPPRGFLLPTCRPLPRFRKALSPCRRTYGRVPTGPRPPQNMFDGLIHKSAVAVEEPPAKWWVGRTTHVQCAINLPWPCAMAMRRLSLRAHSTPALHGLWMPPRFLLIRQLGAVRSWGLSVPCYLLAPSHTRHASPYKYPWHSPHAMILLFALKVAARQGAVGGGKHPGGI